MADTKSTIALNIGSQRISMGVFAPGKKGGLILKGYASDVILADPSTDPSRLNKVRDVVANLSSRLKLGKSSKISYAISGKSVFTRFIKLPPIEDDNLEQLVSFEAQQHIPFPLEEVIWDWTQLESQSGEKEVLIVAIRRAALNEVNDVVVDAGLGTHEVDASPMALYSALRYNYPDLDEPTLLVDIGARTCNLVYVDGARMFTRSINVGGSAITSAIAKQYGVSFEEAEAQKCANGMVSLNSAHTEQMEEAIGAMATVIRTALTKLPAEISSTTNYFRSQHAINAPKRVMLGGGGANLNFLADFLQERLRLPVELFNPLRRIAVGKAVNPDEIGKEAHKLGELVGIGLRSIDKAVLNIDLVPDIVSHERDLQKRKPMLMGAAALFLAALASYAVFNASKASKAQSEIVELQAKIDERLPYSKPLKDLQKSEKELDEIAAQYRTSQASRVQWVDMWNDLAQKFASESVWLIDFDPVVGFNSEITIAENASAVKSVVSAEYGTLAYGSSALAKLKRTAQAPRRGRPAKGGEATGNGVNAIRVKGFWRGGNGHREVFKLLDALREQSEFFNVLSSEQVIVSLPTTLKDGDYAAPFELILALKDSVSTPQSSE